MDTLYPVQYKLMLRIFYCVNKYSYNMYVRKHSNYIDYTKWESASEDRFCLQISAFFFFSSSTVRFRPRLRLFARLQPASQRVTANSTLYLSKRANHEYIHARFLARLALLSLTIHSTVIPRYISNRCA